MYKETKQNIEAFVHQYEVVKKAYPNRPPALLDITQKKHKTKGWVYLSGGDVYVEVLIDTKKQLFIFTLFQEHENRRKRARKKKLLDEIPFEEAETHELPTTNTLLNTTK